MDLSIIIVNWNTRDLILQCLDSIYKNNINKLNFEIIVVDNGSSDDSCSEIKKKYNDIILIENKKNLGFAKANNIGIKKSKGKYIALINSDIIVLDNCLDLLFEYMEKNNDIGIIAPKILNPDLSYQYSCRRLPSVWNNLIEALGISKIFKNNLIFGGEFLNLDKLKKVKKVGILSGCFWFIRKKALDEVGLLDENFFFYGEDKDLCIRFWKKKWKVIYFPQAQSIHYGGASSSIMAEKFYIELQKAQLYFWRKHYSKFKANLFIFCRLLNLCIRVYIGAFLLYFNKKDKGKVNIRKKALLWLIENKKNK